MGTVLRSFPSGLIIGGLIGSCVALVTGGQGQFLAGIILGVVLEQLFLAGKRFVDDWRNTHPIHAVLGTIAIDPQPYVFFSSFFRDLSRPEQYRLLRAQASPEAHAQSIVGPVWLLGEGDATAISLVQGLLMRMGRRPDQVRLERAEKHMEEWGLSCVCIGAHNPRTRVILAKSPKCPYVFDLNYKVITLREDVPAAATSSLPPLKRGVFICQAEDSEPTDYGVLARIADPFHPGNKTVILVAGLGPAGTAGAAYYLVANLDYLAKLKGDFAILVQVPSGYQSARKVEFADVADYYGLAKEA